MPYKPRDIYRGRRKFRVPLTILLFAAAGVLILAVALFYGLQQYLVYDQGGVTLQLPGSGQEAVGGETVQATPEPTPAPQPVAVEIVYQDPDFSDIDLAVGEELTAQKLLFVEYKEVVEPVALATRLSDAQTRGCTGVVLELKPRTGQLAWGSMTEMAVGYGVSGTLDFTDTVQTLHDQGLTACAQLSVCADTLMATRNWTMALQNANGAPYADSDSVYWLDPYNHTLRGYIIGLMGDLAAMGFDEIILADLYHPVDSAGFRYTVSLQTEPKPAAAVCQLARSLAEAMDGYDLRLSALISGTSLREDRSSVTGQDLAVFTKLFDRLYCPTDANTAASDLEAAGEFFDGGVGERFVPVCYYSAPEGFDSWVLKIPAAQQ